MVISMVVFGVEGRQSDLHHLELLIMLLLFLQLVVHVKHLQVVLSKRHIVVISQCCSCHLPEIMRFFCLAVEGIFVLGVELLLVDHSVALLHILSRPWHFFLNETESTLCWLRFPLKRSSFEIMPKGFFLRISDGGVSVW